VIGLAAAPGTVTINDPSCVNKTFPQYWDYMQKLHDAAIDGQTGQTSQTGQTP